MTKSNRHSAEQIKVGMSSKAVAELLGPPTRTTTLQNVLSHYKTVIGNVPDQHKEFWLYDSTPPGHVTHIAINDGVVEEVRIDKMTLAYRIHHIFKK